MIKTLTEKEEIFNRFISNLGLTNVYDSFIIHVPSGPKFIRVNEFDEIEVYKNHHSELLKVVIMNEYNDDLDLFLKITRGI